MMMAGGGGAELGIYCPAGAVGYDSGGNIIVALAAEGWVTGASGQVVFKTAQDYGNVDIIPGTYEALVVAGGGGGGRHTAGGSGGGGAGGLLYDPALVVSDTTIPVEVGVKGIGGLGDSSNRHGTQGGSSKFGTLNPTGGGAGWGSSDAGDPDIDGGSGGGSRNNNTPGTGILGQGHDGAASGSLEGGGGGGADAAGSGLNGGNGKEYFGHTYAGGGRGVNGGTGNAGSGQDNPGGGGNALTAGNGQDGKDGIIIVRWGGYAHNYDPTA
jgi:hypothetical protein